MGLLTAAGDALYVPTTEDGLVAIDATTGEIRWRAELDGSVNTQIAVTGGLVFVTQRFQDLSGQIVAFAAPERPAISAVVASPRPVCDRSPAGGDVRGPPHPERRQHRG
jgi:outer membrane protein assembly factor BamB